MSVKCPSLPLTSALTRLSACGAGFKLFLQLIPMSFTRPQEQLPGAAATSVGDTTFMCSFSPQSLPLPPSLSCSFPWDKQHHELTTTQRGKCGYSSYFIYQFGKKKSGKQSEKRKLDYVNISLSKSEPAERLMLSSCCCVFETSLTASIAVISEYKHRITPFFFILCHYFCHFVCCHAWEISLSKLLCHCAILRKIYTCT